MITRTARARTPLLTVMLVAALVMPAWAQQGAPIAIGPQVQNVSDISATICWATVAGQVNYAPAGAEVTPLHAYEHHSVRLQNLKPGTTYTYDVLGDGTDHGKGAFTTAPQGEHPFSFAVVGDTQNRNNLAHRPIAERIIAEKPDLVFNVGDLVSDGLDILDWETFFQVNADLMRSIPYYAALGNHDREARYFFDFFALPGNERWYSFNRGAAHFVVLDVVGPYISETDPPPSKGDMALFFQAGAEHWRRQMEWLKQDLEDSRQAKYVFVFFHYPMYSVNTKQDIPRDMRQHFGTIFQDHQASVVFNGHNHNYHRAVAGGVTFVVTGVSGPGSTAMPQPESVKYAGGPTHMRVEVGPQKAVVRAIGLNGETVDEFEVAPRAASAAAPTSAK